MRKTAFFFGSLIVLVGVMLLAINLGFVTTKIWTYFWPLVLVLLGGWFIVGTYTRHEQAECVERSIPLEGATEAEIEFNYGVGLLNVSPTSNTLELAGGKFTGGLMDEVNRMQGKAIMKLSTPTDAIFPTHWVYGHQGLGWEVGLTKDIPLKLRFHTGACEARLNLEDLKVTDLVVETGASKTDVTLPRSAGLTRVKVSSGAAEVTLTVPQGVAALIKESSGLSGINVDTQRFIQNGHTYQSADYETAANKVEILYEGGVGSIHIH